ncbi:MAG: alkaline phosphatase D family protein [Flavobacteriales bacterium]|nr:alkaline phosphatase D family protein [Flavobacteriales bacterium]
MKKSLLLSFAFLLNLGAHAQFDPGMAPFHHGVASGDALADRVIIWTRVTPSDPNDSYEVEWQVASDESFSNVVANGSELTDGSVDFTVKVDATGLAANTGYWYRFSMEGSQSIVGRTHTAPDAQVESLRFAVASCQKFDAGAFYNAYSHLAERTDIDAVIFLGDYIYESGGTTTGTGTVIEPAHEILSLEDYRQRYASYRLDSNLRKVHQQWPFYSVWDDHETANDAWSGGAGNHDPATEGPWADRKANGQQAYFEWLPIRPTAPDSYSIYRTIPMGPLMDLIMIDTRLEGRDEQVALTSPDIDDASRTILGSAQKQWFKDQLSTSTAQWKIIGNQVMFAPLELPAIPIIFPNGGILNADQWDGYRADRREIIEHLYDNSIDNAVILTGDIHTSWGNDIPHPDMNYDPNTGQGSVAVEFVTTSITSGNSPVTVGSSIVSSANPHIKYIDLAQKGYVVLDVNQQRVKGSWFYVSSITESTFTVSETDALVTISGQNFLRPESTLSADDLTPVPSSLRLKLHPNPTDGLINMGISTAMDDMLFYEVYDVMGRQLTTSVIGQLGAGEHQVSADLTANPAGLYMIRVLNGHGEAVTGLFLKD